MRIPTLASLCALTLSAAVAAAESSPALPPPLWASKPDVAAFNKIEDGHLDAAKKAIDALAAVKDKRTIENTLVPYDDATR